MNDLIPPITDVFDTSDGNRIFFGDWPAASPLPFAAAHGLTNQHRNLAGPAAVLSGEVRFIARDLRGRGNSSKPGPGSYGMARHGQDVLEMMDWVGVPKCSPVAAKEDLEDVVQAERELNALLDRLRCPVLAIGAQYGILMAPEPVLGEEHFAKLRSVVNDVETITVPGPTITRWCSRRAALRRARMRSRNSPHSWPEA